MVYRTVMVSSSQCLAPVVFGAASMRHDIRFQLAPLKFTKQSKALFRDIGCGLSFMKPSIRSLGTVCAGFSKPVLIGGRYAVLSDRT